MDVLDIARWQFGITTVYHFLMVPLTIGLGVLVAVMHTMWVRTDKPEWLRMTRFWGRIYLINFVARRGHRPGTGVPVRAGLERVLAVRRRRVRLAAGDGGAARVLPRVDVPGPVDLRLGPDPEEGAPGHPVGGGRSARCVSAYFIIAANSWMQHPVGVVTDDASRPAAPGRLPGRADQQHRARRVQPRDRRRR